MNRPTAFNAVSVPRIAVPAGGGAPMPAGEHFSADAFTGSASFTMPVPLPAARALTPDLQLSYNSGNGNGILGMGFSLSASSISIRTNRALPLYNDADCYTLDAAELVFQHTERSAVDGKDAAIDTFLERFQSAFVLIQKISTADSVYWRVTGNDNSVSLYGNSVDSRISDPAHKQRVFRWLLSEENDAAGNRVVYTYTRFSPDEANSYLTSIDYGNYRGRQGQDQFAFRALIDYGQLDLDTQDDRLTYKKETPKDPIRRTDTVCNAKPGFLLTTSYLVRNILVTHHFEDDPATGDPCCTDWIRFAYSDVKGAAAVSTLNRITRCGLIRANGDAYTFKSLPPTDLGFIPFAEQQPLNFSPITDDKGEPIRQPLNLIDLHQTGFPGVLYRNAETLLYYEAMGDGAYHSPSAPLTAPIRFADPRAPMNIVSLEGDGRLQLQLDDYQYSGYYPRDPQFQWQSFVPFPHSFLDDQPHRTESLDLSGSGRTDRLLITPDKLVYHASLGLQGMSDTLLELDNPSLVEAENIPVPEKFYGFENIFGDGLLHRVKVENGQLTVWPNLGYGHFGQKLVVPIPSLVLTAPDMDLHQRLVFADVNGSGPADLVLVFRDQFAIYFNEGGLSFSDPLTMAFPTDFSWCDTDTIRFADVAGNGNTCLVFSRQSPHVYKDSYRDTAHYYAEFNSAGKGICNKPFLLRSVSNNQGAETTITYSSSIRDYLRDQQQQPWYTHLPFPVIVTRDCTVRDAINQVAHTISLSYRNGCYDPVEHSFLGFGAVTQTASDTDLSDTPLLVDTPVTLTKNWFHLGNGFAPDATLREFYAGGKDVQNFPFAPTDAGADCTALAGSPLHSEIYDQADPPVPYETSSTAYLLRCVQPASTTQPAFAVQPASVAQPASAPTKAVYSFHPFQTLDIQYDQRPDDPLLTHELVLEVDVFNHVLKSCSIAYPRRDPLIPEQALLFCTASQARMTNQAANDLPRWLGVPLEKKTFAISGLLHPEKSFFAFDELKTQVIGGFDPDDGALAAGAPLAPDVPPPAGAPQPAKNAISFDLLGWQREHYWADPAQLAEWSPPSPLPAVLLHKFDESAMFDDAQVRDILGDRVDDAALTAAGYAKTTTTPYWWNRSAVAHFHPQDRFFLLKQLSYDWVAPSSALYTEDSVVYDAYCLLPVTTAQRLSDAITLTTSAKIDYRTLQPWQVTDTNKNCSEVLLDACGMVIASATYANNGIDGDAPLSAFTPPAVKDIHEVLADPLKYIRQAGSFHFYQFATEKEDAWSPTTVLTLARTTYKPSDPSQIQLAISYLDGFGHPVETRCPADNATPGKMRWRVSGKTLSTIGGHPICSYQGYFNPEPDYEQPWRDKLPADLPPPAHHYYDALGRETRVTTPKGFFAATLILNPWETQHFDENDTLPESPYYTAGNWKSDPQEKDAIDKATVFYNTPMTNVTDALGRAIIRVADIGDHGSTPIDWKKTRLSPTDIDPTLPGLLVNWQSYDLAGRLLLHADPRFNADNQKAAPDQRKYNVRNKYPLAGGISGSLNTDAGAISGYTDIHGNSVVEWDAAGIRHAYTYDNLQRLLTHHVQTPAGHLPAADQPISVLVYGETHPTALQNNMLGKTWKQYDGAGLAITSAYTFDEHPVDQTMRFRKEYKTEPDWGADKLKQEDAYLETASFLTKTHFDAAGRPITQTLPDGSIHTWTYGPTGNCTASTADLQGKGNPRQILQQSDLDAIGNLTRIQYANGVISSFQYDPLTSSFTGGKTSTANSILQQAQCWYDPCGHLTTLQNTAADPIFFDNKQVDPQFSYTYDPLYRLQKARARLLLGGADLKASENYTESYAYDKGNNLVGLQRVCTKGYTRTFSIAPENNRVTGYEQGDQKSRIDYDTAGHMQHTDGAGTSSLQWNVLGNIAAAIIIQRDKTPNDAVYYVYSNGMRTRTVTERYDAGGKLTDGSDKRYLGDYRRTTSLNGDALHSMTIGGAARQDAVLQYRTASGNDTALGTLFRFQHTCPVNVLSLETNDKGDPITYEEYSPFGETVYRYDPSNLGSTREYAYDRKEKDALTGLYYFGFRYYAPGLCRWTCPDPGGTIDGPNLYVFAGNDPVGNSDLMGLVSKKPKSQRRQNASKLQSYSLKKQEKFQALQKFEQAHFTEINQLGQRKVHLLRNDQTARTLVNIDHRLSKIKADFEQQDSAGGGLKNYVSTVEAVKKSRAVNKLKQLFIQMRRRTPTRHGFVVSKGAQGPHTVARVNRLELHQHMIESMKKRSAARIHADVYAAKIIDPTDLRKLEMNTGLREALDKYIAHYTTIHDLYKGALKQGDELALTAHGESLMDLHPYATSRSVATQSDIAGGGESRQQSDIFKIFDYPRGNRYAGGQAHHANMQAFIKGFVEAYQQHFGHALKLTIPARFKFYNK